MSPPIIAMYKSADCKTMPDALTRRERGVGEDRQTKSLLASRSPFAVAARRAFGFSRSAFFF